MFSTNIHPHDAIERMSQGDESEEVLVTLAEWVGAMLKIVGAEDDGDLRQWIADRGCDGSELMSDLVEEYVEWKRMTCQAGSES